MVSKQLLKEYDFETIEQYFEYIVESIINGQRTQANSLLKNLSKKQLKQALQWFDECIETFDTNHYKEAKQLTLNYL
ncbi:MAG: hypothetical protein PQJ49_12510 [Sphaerochaetaceae bacterium]|nr:hypothetical protein [Sphaerochaetaceae bacterium]